MTVKVSKQVKKYWQLKKLIVRAHCYIKSKCCGRMIQSFAATFFEATRCSKCS